MHEPARLVSRSRPLVAALPLIVALTACSSHKQITRPVENGGVPPEAIGAALHAIDDVRSIADLTAINLQRDGRVESSWTFDEAIGRWSRTTTGYQSVWTSTPGGTSTELRNETVIAQAIQFLKGGAVVRDFMLADHARMELNVRERRYALDPSYEVSEPYDVTVSFRGELALTEGSVGPLAAEGELSGWSERVIDGAPMRVDYDGVAAWRFDYPGHPERCPAETMSANVRVLRDRVELDRYAGSFGAAAGADLVTGSLDSQRGPGRYGINRYRGPCIAGS